MRTLVTATRHRALTTHTSGQKAAGTGGGTTLTGRVTHDAGTLSTAHTTKGAAGAPNVFLDPLLYISLTRV